MANVVSMELFKAHLKRCGLSGTDIALQQYLDAAEMQVVQATNRTEEELAEMNGGEFPAMLVQAILLQGGNFVENGSANSSVQMHPVPYGLSALIKPFRKLCE